ncbi:maleylpyruvate isomerase family mycothiol-dependent enzyme [Nocardioides stalactiti]|uniref:maleylpyruvate isomerase family mycothiol-dependent enzyme n=1 Tax=Nocardioides stalactiti TaxID=2755356 RepID=UPI0016004F8D|nr:maleylpyruvate isomerase family mycothiol-dependent enzyme [Nocardioides stalactiti]
MDWMPLLREATARFAGVLADGDLDASVPACPDWTLRDLADHLGGVHQWAAHAVVVGDARGEPTPAPTDQVALARWYEASARDLVTVLLGTPVEATAWTFGPEQVAGFWRRRQVHETLIHLYDALASQQRQDEWTVAPEVAWDGVDEVATIFYDRQVRLERTAPLPGTLRLLPTDVEAGPIDIGPGAGVVDLPGTASDLLLALWKRATVSDPEAARLLAMAITP